jgi:hypothetical protein
MSDVWRAALWRRRVLYHFIFARPVVTKTETGARRSPYLQDGVHPGVARGLTFSVDLRQDRAPSLADTAELRPCHPEKVA